MDCCDQLASGKSDVLKQAPSKSAFFKAFKYFQVPPKAAGSPQIAIPIPSHGLSTELSQHPSSPMMDKLPTSASRAMRDDLHNTPAAD